MTSPEPLERGPENPLIGWAKAIALGLRDTAEDMLEAGRKGANDAYNQYWDRFDEKTKHRRKRTK